jgi:predicted Ser/Thr protein kinase
VTQYERLQLIGEGRQGLVYRAHDRVRGRTVALKTLHALEPEGVYRLKREFRALADLSHPNLVELYDLVVDDGECFFTMELVEGVDLVTWARAAGATRAASVRAAARQLALAIGTLHAAGKLHRDVKPTNVLVEAGGRVVVLDFGLAAGVGGRGRAGTLAGTLPYVAPEQLWGAPPTPASDWYSVGATLYEALVDRVPFGDEALAALAAGGAVDAPSPSELSGEIPADLAALTMELLRREPAERPSFETVVRRLGGEAVVPDGGPVEVPFVGRGPELAALDAALRATRDGAVTVHLRGVSGIGKTALVEHFLAGVEERGAAIAVRGRCHPHESIPFKAVDGVIDELSRVLVGLPAAARAAMLPADVEPLVRVFPILAGVPGLGEAAAGPLEGEAHEVRRRAFHALREVVGRVAAASGLVVWIDDLQWGDLDSIAVLDELRRPPGLPRLLLVQSFRSEDEAASEPLGALRAAADDLEPMPPPLEIELGPLTAAEARALASRVLAHAPWEAAEHDLDVIAAESNGSPFFAGELARHFAMRTEDLAWTALALGDVVERRIEMLPDASRQVLNVVAIAGRPIDDALAAHAAGIDDARPVCRRLRHQLLLRAVTAGGGAAVAVYHDRIGDAVARLLSADARRALHRRLADALETRADPDPLLLVEHYLQAGESERAAEYAHSSAERAARALAFHQAARLYQRALDLGSTARPRWQLQADRARALENAGFGAEAAHAYRAAADDLAATDPGDLEILRLKRRAADQFLRSGCVDEGLAAVREVLRAVDLRYFESTWGALLSLIVNRVRLRVARGLAAPGAPRRTAFDRERLEACWAAGLGVSVFDSLRGAEFQVRHALLSRGTDDPSHRARSLATEAVVMAMEHPRRHRRQIAALRSEGAACAAASGDPRAEAHTLLMSAGVAFFENRYREALDYCERGEELCRARCVGSAWELANMQFVGAYSLAYLGELDRLRARLPGMLRHARERGDQFALTNYRIGLIILAWLAHDDVEAARRELEAALAGRSPQRSAWQHYMGMYAHVHVDLYAGEPARAWQRLADAQPALRRAQMLRLQSIRLETRLLRARAALAMAARPPAGGLPDGMTPRALLRQAARDARAIGAERAAWSEALAASLEGGIAALQDRAADAAGHLARAALAFDRLDLGMHAAAVRHQLGAVDAGEAGRAGRERSDEWMRAQRVAMPARMAALFVPGFRTV